MKLSALLQIAGLEAPNGPDPEIAGVTDDSRHAGPGIVFVAARGGQFDGHQFVPQALEAGSAAVVVELPRPEGVATPWIAVDDSRRVLGLLAHAVQGGPSDAMMVIGVTGTNGKTTTAWLLESILRQGGHKTALLGTLFYRIGDETLPAPNTTASAVRNAELFGRMRDSGVQCAAMEVSSHAIDQRRIEGIHFRAGVLTNITQDHLDYHGTMEAYAATKRRFFDETLLATPDAVAAFNLDDPLTREIAGGYKGRCVKFSLREQTLVRGLDVRTGLDGIRMRVEIDDQSIEIHSRLIGRFNVENILAATAGAVALGLPLDQIVAGLKAARGVPGRFERIDEGQPFLAAVDYAHTPDALERALANAREMTQGKLIVVFGCGGDRDKSKRPKMGLAVGRGADHALLTNDNPRTEDPETIAAMAEAGLRQAGGRYEVLLDRRMAIQRAVGMAGEGDFVLIAGKGHEPYQEIGRERTHFDDREEARAALRAGGWTSNAS